MGLKVITPPAVEPVSLAEAKLHLRVEHDSEDALIASLISAARGQCEHLLETVVPVQTLQLSIDAFPADGIPVKKGPVADDPFAVVEIESIEYVDADGITQTMAPGDYYLDDSQTPCWVLPALGIGWPVARAEANAVRMTYRVGYDPCPDGLRSWILLKVGSLYQHREADSDKPAQASPFADRLLDRYRIWGV